MFHVASTARPKLVAKDFTRVLKNLGHPLSYSKLLGAVAHMYGYASFGMMQRMAGGASPSPDDAAAIPAVAEQRRKEQIADRKPAPYLSPPIDSANNPRDHKGEEFIIDRWPTSRLIVASLCSGHGAKFTPAIGAKIARRTTDPSYEVARFSTFAPSARM